MCNMECNFLAINKQKEIIDIIRCRHDPILYMHRFIYACVHIQVSEKV